MPTLDSSFRDSLVKLTEESQRERDRLLAERNANAITHFTQLATREWPSDIKIIHLLNDAAKRGKYETTLYLRSFFPDQPIEKKSYIDEIAKHATLFLQRTNINVYVYTLPNTTSETSMARSEVGVKFEWK